MSRVGQWRSAVRAAEAEVAPPVDAAPPERLWAALHGELEHGEALDAVDAALAAATGFEELELAAVLREEIGAIDAGPPRHARRWPVAVLAVAAALLGAVALGSVHWEPPAPTPAAEFRGTAAAVVPTVPNGASLSADAFVLAWEPGPTGSKYTIKVSTAKGRILAVRRNLVEPEFTVPATALLDVESGTTIMWQVEITRGDGSFDRSPTFRVVLR